MNNIHPIRKFCAEMLSSIVKIYFVLFYGKFVLAKIKFEFE